MPFFHLVILALVQGITEFLPVSSSGHLVLVHHLTGQNTGWEQDLLIDVAVHVGTLFAVLLYFRKDICNMIRGVKNEAGQNMAVLVVLASLPVIIAGFLLYSAAPDFLRSLEVMAWCTLVFGIVLWAADRFKPEAKTLEQMGWKDALGIGFAQCLALVPGTSRSGITMTAARFFGYSRVEAARFSLFLAIVAISGAGTLGGIDVLKAPDAAFGLDVLIAAALAFFTALAAIHLMLKWLEKSSFTPFAIYRVLLGLILLGLIYSGSI